MIGQPIPAGIEPAIFGSVDRRLIHWATGPHQQGKVDEALALWSEVLKLNPSMETARLNYAVALFRTGRKNEAKASLNEALRFNPASRRARELLAGLQ